MGVSGINTFALRGVLVLRGLSRQLSGRSTSTLRFSKTCKKKSIGAIGFRFVPLDSLMFVVSVTVFSFLQAMLVRMLGCRERTLAQQTFGIGLNACLCFIAVDPAIRRIELLCPSPSMQV